MVLGTLPILAVLAVTIIIIDVQTVQPKRYASVESRIADWNAAHWETGKALELTAQMAGPDARTEGVKTVSVTCVNKQFRSGRSALARYVRWPKRRAVDPVLLSVAFGEEARLRFDMSNLCDKATYRKRPWDVPQRVRPKAIHSEMRIQGERVYGTLRNDQLAQLADVFQLQIVSVESTPIRELMDKEQYLAMVRYW